MFAMNPDSNYLTRLQSIQLNLC